MIFVHIWASVGEEKEEQEKANNNNNPVLQSSSFFDKNLFAPTRTCTESSLAGVGGCLEMRESNYDLLQESNSIRCDTFYGSNSARPC